MSRSVVEVSNHGRGESKIEDFNADGSMQLVGTMTPSGCLRTGQPQSDPMKERPGYHLQQQRHLSALMSFFSVATAHFSPEQGPAREVAPTRPPLRLPD